jgi:amino acid transporter
MAELRIEADHRLKNARPRSTAGALVIILIWLSLAAATVYWLMSWSELRHASALCASAISCASHK